MKIKILKSDDWYKDYVGTEFEVSRYDLTSHAVRFSVFNHGWIYVSDCVITELPESFCVKRCDDKEKWRKYINWLNKTYAGWWDSNGTSWIYYGIESNGKVNYNNKPFGTEIHIDDMIKHIDYMERHVKGGEQFHKESQLTVKMEKQKLSRQGLKEIHSVACSSWKETLEQFGRRNPLEDYIELTQEEINIMFDACTKEQLPIVSKYLTKDDSSVDIMKFKCEVYDNDGRAVIEKRCDGEYAHKSLLLEGVYYWEIKKDSKSKLCLIPTKKK